MDIAVFRTMQALMMRVQDRASRNPSTDPTTEDDSFHAEKTPQGSFPALRDYMHFDSNTPCKILMSCRVFCSLYQAVLTLCCLKEKQLFNANIGSVFNVVVAGDIHITV